MNRKKLSQPVTQEVRHFACRAPIAAPHERTGRRHPAVIYYAPAGVFLSFVIAACAVPPLGVVTPRRKLTGETRPPATLRQNSVRATLQFNSLQLNSIRFNGKSSCTMATPAKLDALRKHYGATRREPSMERQMTWTNLAKCYLRKPLYYYYL